MEKTRRQREGLERLKAEEEYRATEEVLRKAREEAEAARVEAEAARVEAEAARVEARVRLAEELATIRVSEEERERKVRRCRNEVKKARSQVLCVVQRVVLVVGR